MFSLALKAAATVPILASLTFFSTPAAAQGPEQPDNYTWLEDIHGEKPMAWVKAENARTASVLEKDARFAQLQADALKVLESPERLPDPDLAGGMIYNKWRDAQHLRGIVRRTTVEDYLSAEPKWETVLDYDALSKQDNQSWVGEELNYLEPDESLCLVELSAGGEDAVTIREFDLKARKFVEGGFNLPRGKQTAAWMDKDTLLVGRDWGAGTMSEAGYPITVRAWKRGEPLANAKEIFRGDVKDNGYGDRAEALVDGQGHRAIVIERNLTTFTREYYLVVNGTARKLNLPSKTEMENLLDGQLIITLNEDWTTGGETLKQGAVISVSLEAAKKDPEHLKPTVIFAPSVDEFEQQIATTKDDLLMTTLKHVQGRAYVYTHGTDGGWVRKQVEVPANQTVYIATTSKTDDRFFIGLDGFINPPSLMLGNGADGSLKLAKAQKPLFDASDLTVDQLEAKSKDGTGVPYFVAHRKTMSYDGSNPTLLTAYGGFQVSETPYYSAATGKLWLERGGVYVMANIRGGGEFGPEWHEAGLKTHRQRIYDDFYAVAQDLVTRKITSSRRLGIMGGSNGGLLMGVQFTQHPEMWQAVVIQVPLLDMLGYEHLSAGASWVGEYGSVSVPEERRFLASISPYNQLRPGMKYPEPLIFTTTKDDRVGPVHARKFAARMEEFGYPFFYDEITEGGHGPGADTRQEARTRAEVFTYLSMKLMDWPSQLMAHTNPGERAKALNRHSEPEDR
jgi:prolyl oligopeptidase